VVTEPLKQAEQNVMYEIYAFERFKRTFAVRVASDYLSVLQAIDQIANAEQNYRSLVTSSRRARRLADVGKIPEFQFDQTVQDELRARDRWVAAREAYAGRLDQFKVLLGLPTDARVELEPDELDRLRTALKSLTEGAGLADYSGKVPPADAPVHLPEPGVGKAGPYEVASDRAVKLALAKRLDLRTAKGRVYDAQRDVFVAADSLRAELTLVGSAQAGERRGVRSADSGNASLDPGEGYYSALLTLDLPLERTAERNDYRKSLLSLQEAVRAFQELEDGVKLAVRDRLRELLEAREGLRTQAEAVRLAQKRVQSVEMFFELGRAEVRDLLDAQSSLITAQNGLTSAAVSYRVAELELQRDLGVLEVNEQGLWQEYSPQEE
jgi:outer membrane protein TolC